MLLLHVPECDPASLPAPAGGAAPGLQVGAVQLKQPLMTLADESASVSQPLWCRKTVPLQRQLRILVAMADPALALYQSAAAYGAQGAAQAEAFVGPASATCTVHHASRLGKPSSAELRASMLWPRSRSTTHAAQ